MGGQSVGGWRARARATALGVCIAIVATLGLAEGVAAVVDVSGTSVTLGWEPAPGPVHSYLVFVSRDGEIAQGRHAVTTPRVTLTGDPGETIQVWVAAWRQASGENQGLLSLGRMGPISPGSARIRFSHPAPPPSSQPADEGADEGDAGEAPDAPTGTPEDGLPDHAGVELVAMARSWELLDTGDFLGDGGDDVLFRFSGQQGVFVLDLANGRVEDTHLVTWHAATARRGPWRDDRDTLLVHTPAGALEGWAFESGKPTRRWTVQQPALQRSMAADLDGDRVEEVLRRFDDGSLRLSDGSSLPLPTLRSRQRVRIAEVNGDLRDDVVVADLLGGQLDLWLEGRRHRSAPTLEANLEDLELAWLQGSRPWLVGVDAGGRLRARPLDDPGTRTLGFVGRGARVHPADVDGDGRDELLVLHEDALSLWQPGS